MKVFRSAMAAVAFSSTLAGAQALPDRRRHSRHALRRHVCHSARCGPAARRGPDCRRAGTANAVTMLVTSTAMKSFEVMPSVRRTDLCGGGGESDILGRGDGARNGIRAIARKLQIVCTFSLRRMTT